MAYRLISNLFTDGDEESMGPGKQVYGDYRTASEAAETLAERFPNAEVDVEEFQSDPNPVYIKLSDIIGQRSRVMSGSKYPGMAW